MSTVSPSSTGKGALVARVLLGLGFFVFGLNGFVAFLPQPEHPGAAGAFLGALAASGYMLPLIKGTELIAGGLILSGRYTSFGLVLLAPVLVNIVAFHLALDPKGLAPAIVFLALEVYLAWVNRAAYAPIFAAPAPASANATEARAPREAHAA